MKKHWFGIIAYLLGIFLVWGCIVIFQQPYLLMLSFIMLVLPCLSVWFFYLTISKLELKTYSKVASVETGNTVTFVVECKNNSYFPIFAGCIHFTLENLYHPNSMVHMLSLPILPRRSNRIEIPVETANAKGEFGKCGMLSFQVKTLEVSDFMHFLTKNMPFNNKVQVPVFPVTHEVELPSTVPVTDGMEEFTESDNKGNLSSDIKEIRDYRPGDRLQRIHWKLSAKLDDLLVKEMEHTTELSLVLLPEFNPYAIHETAATLLSVMETLYKREERFEVCLYNHLACEFTYFLITEQSQIAECMIHFFYTPLYARISEKATAIANNKPIASDASGEAAAKDAYFASSQKAATILHICGKKIQRIDQDNAIG